MALDMIEGGDGVPPEPEWNLLLDDPLELVAAAAHWRRLVQELRDTEKLALANEHQIKRLVIAYIMHDRAMTKVTEQDAVIQAKRTGVPQYNPWWTILTQAASLAAALEAELTITPLRRARGGKVQRKTKKVTGAAAFLKSVPK